MLTPSAACTCTWAPHLHHTQACSILYKSRLPVLLVFNKVDVARHEFALDWMADFDNFHQVRVMARWGGVLAGCAWCGGSLVGCGWGGGG